MGFTFEVIGAVGGTGGSTRRPNAFLAARVGGLWPGEVTGPPLKVSPPGWPGKVTAGLREVHPFWTSKSRGRLRVSSLGTALEEPTRFKSPCSPSRKFRLGDHAHRILSARNLTIFPPI
jgi:hypothetical protein